MDRREAKAKERGEGDGSFRKTMSREYLARGARQIKMKGLCINFDWNQFVLLNTLFALNPFQHRPSWSCTLGERGLCPLEHADIDGMEPCGRCHADLPRHHGVGSCQELLPMGCRRGELLGSGLSLLHFLIHFTLHFTLSFHLLIYFISISRWGGVWGLASFHVLIIYNLMVN